jgi:hypothetical protein
MKRLRITIARCLGWTAILAANLAFFRSFGDGRRVLLGGDLIFVALHIGLWCLFRSRGRLRCFWWGFVVTSMAAGVVLLLFEPLLDGRMDRFMTPYTDFVDLLEITYLPTSLSGSLGNELWELHLDVVYFVPLFVAALLGGMIAAWLIPRGLTPARTINREKSTALIG